MRKLPQGVPRTSPEVVVLLLLALSASLGLAAFSPPPAFDPIWLAGLALSALAVPLPGGATYSAGVPLFLWMARLPSGWLPALLGLAAQAALARLRGGRGRQPLLEWLSGLAALSLMVFGHTQSPHPVWVYLGLIVHLGLTLELRWRWAPQNDQRVSYLRMQRSLRKLHLASSVAVLAWQGPWSLALLPLLYSTHWAAANERFRVQAQIGEEVRHMQQELVALSMQKEQVDRELQASQQERAWLDELSRNLATAGDIQQWRQNLGQSLARVTRWDQLLLCQADQSDLPLVQLAQQTQIPQFGDQRQAALPLQPGLTLYLSRQQSPWEAQELRWIVWTVRRAWPTLANLLQAQQAQRKLSELEGLLGASQLLAGQLSLEGLVQVLPGLCATLVEHDWGLLCNAQGQLLGHWGTLPPISRSLAQQALAQGHSQQAQAALAIPLADLGCLVLGAPSLDPQKVRCLEIMAAQLQLTWLRAQALEQLRQYQQQLVLSSQMIAVGGLAAGVAHELNSPLGAVTLMVEGAMRQLEVQPAAALAKLDRAQQALRRARDIVDRLLTQARSPVLENATYRLDDCLREGLTFVEPQLRQAGVLLDLRLSDNPTFVGQAGTVQQVMINLLLNASQAYQGLPQVKKVELATYPWGFSVSDWASGLSDEVAARIFEPFFTTRQGGHGLGLWICQDLLRQQGGSIRVFNRDGTRFEVHLISEASGNP